MRHLLYVIHFTGRFDDMRRFYEDGLGFIARRDDEDDWVEFDTGGASIALHRMKDPKRQGTLLRFATTDLDAALTELRDRGLESDGDVAELSGGRVASFSDADGNRIQLLEPATPVPSGAGEALDTVIVNVSDMVAATGFYRDRFGLPVLLQSPWWTELDTGVSKLSLHPRVAATDELRHNAQSIVCGFEVPNLDELGRELKQRGVEFTGGPVDQRYGRFAEVTDPDGNVVLFRRSEPRAPLDPQRVDEEQIAEAYEDEAPHQAAMRKPVKKGAKATSKVAIKPDYKAKKTAAANSAHAGNGARPRPRPKKAKPGAASGRLRKAERRSATRKKAAVAAVSRTKPVKRASAKSDGRRRG
jgi:predicted enzyme related to lactoylglutathione lyase